MKTVPDVMRAREIGFDPGVLGLTIFPTEKCNFRCVYCYENFPNTKLTNDITSSILRLIENRASDLHTLSIGWFGGEPLLEAVRILQISQFAQNASRSNSFKFKSHITTNGYLLNYDLFERLVDVGICNFQISLDGLESEHNQTRRIMNGAGSFSTIMRNLLSIRKSSKKFDVMLRLHVHRSNARSMIDLIKYIALEFMGDTRFKVNVQKIIDYGNNSSNPLQLADEKTENYVVEQLSLNLPKSQIIDTSDVLHCCYASMPNHFVIRANGKVQKCTVALYDSRNDVGELLLDGSFKWFSQERLMYWSTGLFEGDVEKMTCPWKVISRKNLKELPEQRITINPS